MAYNQGPQRPYDGGHPERRPIPQRQYPDQAQNYPQQGPQGGGRYEQQYAQNDYGYDQGGGYAPQQQLYDQGYNQQQQQQQPPRGRGTPAPQGPPGPRGYAPQSQGQYGDYPARGASQEGYGGRGGDPRAPAPGRGGSQAEYGGRGGDFRAPAPARGGPQDAYSQGPQQRGPPPRGDSRGGYGAPAMNGAPAPRGDGRGYPNGGIPPAQGPGPGPDMSRGGRPPMGRAPNSVPGTQNITKAASFNSTYPQDISLNNSYPSFPVRRTSKPGNHDLTQQFGNLDIYAQPDDRARSLESQHAPRTFSLGNGPNSTAREPSPGYNGGHPQHQPWQQPQGYQEPPRGRPDAMNVADGYSENIAVTGPPLPAALLPAASAYAPQLPQPPFSQQDLGYSDGYGNDGYGGPTPNAGHKREDSVGDVYDAYFGDDDGAQAPIPLPASRSMSADRSRAGKQDDLFFDPPSVAGPQPPSQYDTNYQEFDRRSHEVEVPLLPPKIAIYDGTRSASAAPDSHYQGFPGNNANGWDQNQNAYGAPPPQRGPPMQQGGGYAPAQDQYDSGPAGHGPLQRSMTSLDPGQGGFGPPQRSATAFDPGLGGFVPPPRSMTALDPGMGGFGPPQRSMTSQDEAMGGRGFPPRAINGSISSLSKGPGMGLPAHPAPYRPGLQQIPNGNHMPMTNKPPPIRNYQGGIVDAPARVSTPQPGGVPPAPSGPPSQKKDAPVTSVTTQEIDQLRVTVNSNPNDQATTLLLARKLVYATETLIASIPEPKQRNKTREKWIVEAHRLLKKLVAMNNTDAMFYLADCYGRGALGLETSPAQAFSLYQSAAKAGHAAAAYRTAVCCEIGQDDGGGTRKDPLKAMQWYKRAATLGDTPAMYKMGMIMLKGLLGQPPNNREAVMWLKRAAERADKENPHALHELALLYSEPQSAEGSLVRDEGYSFELFRQGAELGYKFSQFKMGCAYEFGLFNLPISPKESIQWYSKAAIQEEHQSELALSGWYLTGAKDDRTGGIILAQSDTEAYLWARKAAVAGLAKAEYAMGYFTETGIGCAKDLDGAKRWYWRAAAQNFPKARERLEELKRNGGRDGGNPQTQRISRSRVNKNSEAECGVM